MSEHLTNIQIENFVAHRLPSGELVTATRHLAVCNDCRQRVNAQTGAWERVTSLQTSLSADARAVHLSYEQLAAYVDNEADDVAREISANHLALCAQCTSVIQELQRLRESLQTPVPPARKTFLEKLRVIWPAPALLRPMFVTATAVALVLLLTIMWWRRPASAPKPTIAVAQPSPTLAPSVVASETPTPTETPVSIASVNDSGGQITLDRAGSLTGLTALPKDAERAIKQALTTQQLETPAELKALVRRPATLMSDTQEMPTIKLQSPVGTFVQDTQPVFRWQPVPNATNYTVTVLDENFAAVATSPPITQSFWRVATPLKRGQTYLWQVTAQVDGKRVTSTSASAPEAHFKLLNADKARELQTLAQSHNSHLLRGTIYAKAGLLDEAEREFQALRKANPRSSIARKLLRHLRAVRRS